MTQEPLWQPSDIVTADDTPEGGAPKRRGRIPQSAWPDILARYKAGATLTAIARDLNCTPSAISYIVRKAESPDGVGAEDEAETGDSTPQAAAPAPTPAPARAAAPAPAPAPVRVEAPQPTAPQQDAPQLDAPTGGRRGPSQSGGERFERGDRSERGYAGPREDRPRDDRPRDDRPRDDRPRDDRPRDDRPRDDRPRDDRPYGDRPQGERGQGERGQRFERPQRPEGDRFGGPRPQGQPGQGGERPPQADRYAGDRFGGERPQQHRGHERGPDRFAQDRPPQDRLAQDRPPQDRPQQDRQDRRPQNPQQMRGEGGGERFEQDESDIGRFAGERPFSYQRQRPHPGRQEIQETPTEPADQRMANAAKACADIYRAWKEAPGDAGAQALADALHEMRKVMARMEIEMSAGRKEEMRPLPLPAYRTQQRPTQQPRS